MISLFSLPSPGWPIQILIQIRTAERLRPLPSRCYKAATFSTRAVAGAAHALRPTDSSVEETTATTQDRKTKEKEKEKETPQRVRTREELGNRGEGSQAPDLRMPPQ
jgi:hypothetical protein